MIKRYLAAFIAAAALTVAAADAKTLRWASQGDPQTADPFSQNEGLTNMFSQSVHDTLVMRDNTLKLVPGLATSWQQVNPTTWRFTLRQGVKFHDGSPFTADDIVFSYERASHPNSQLRQYAIPVGKPRKIDDFTVEFVQDKPNPITLEHATTIYIMSKAWAIKNKVERPLDFKAKEETFASRNANGTGAWILVTREPGIRDRAETQSGLVGPQGRSRDRQRHRSGLHAGQRRCDAHRRAAVGPGRFHPRPAAAGRASDRREQGHKGDAWAGKPGRIFRLRSSARRAAVFERQGQEPVQGRARAAGGVSRDRHRCDSIAHHARLGSADRRHHALDLRRPTPTPKSGCRTT